MVAIGFAHWPQFVSRWYRDLQRITKYGAVLGKFVTLKECFQESNLMSGATQFEADDYRSPYLRESAAAGVPPISPLITQVNAEASTRSAGVFRTLAALLSGSDHNPSKKKRPKQMRPFRWPRPCLARRAMPKRVIWF